MPLISSVFYPLGDPSVTPGRLDKAPKESESPTDISAPAMPQGSRLVLIDQNLKGLSGHNATTALAILDADPDAEVVANTQCALEHPRIQKVLSVSFNSPAVRFPGGGSLLYRIWATLRAVCYNNRFLRRALDTTAARRERQIWIWRDGDARNAYAALGLARRYAKLRIILYFHNHPSRLLLRLFAIKMRLLRVRNLVCVHEDHDLAKRFSDVTGLDCGVLPFPFPVRPPRPISGTEKEPPVIAVLGSPRIEKGIDIVVDAIRQLTQELKDDRLRFVIQAQDTGDNSVKPALAALQAQAAQLPAIRLIDEPLPEEAYAAELYKADVLLLPYRLSAYALRNSGVVMEGISAGKVLVITAGTLAAVRAEGAAAFLAVKDGDATSIATALREVLTNLPTLRKAAMEYSRAYSNEHDPAVLISKLKGLFEHLERS